MTQTSSGPIHQVRIMEKMHRKLVDNSVYPELVNGEPVFMTMLPDDYDGENPESFPYISEEWERLERACGQDNDKNISYRDLAYPGGLDQFKELVMDFAKKPMEPAAEKAKPKKVKATT